MLCQKRQSSTNLWVVSAVGKVIITFMTKLKNKLLQAVNILRISSAMVTNRPLLCTALKIVKSNYCIIKAFTRKK